MKFSSTLKRQKRKRKKREGNESEYIFHVKKRESESK
jgi:hypothetical protein